MSDGLMIAALIASGAPWVFVGLLAGGIWSPGIALIGLLAWAGLARTRPLGSSPDLAFCRSVADGLRTGSSLRLSLAGAADRTDRPRMARLCRSGRPFDELALHMESDLPVAGPAVAAAIRSAGSSGGRSAGVFDAIALSVAQEEEFLGEIRSATAHVRASALLIVSIAIGAVVVGAASGRPGAVSHGGRGLSVVVGVSLLAIGSIWIARAIRKAEGS